MTSEDPKFRCPYCGTGTDRPQEEQGLDFCHTQDCDWLIANVKPDRWGWRDTPGTTQQPSPQSGRRPKRSQSKSKV